MTQKAKRTKTRRSKITVESSGTDFARLDATTDAEIAQHIADDPDTAPELDDAWFAAARRQMPRPKVKVLLNLDAHTVEYFKSEGRGYQARIDAVLRSYVEQMEARGPAK